MSLLVDTVLADSLAADLARAEAENRLARHAPEETDRRVVDFLLLEPTGLDLGTGLRFDPSEARRLLDLGREVGTEAIGRWRSEGAYPDDGGPRPPGVAASPVISVRAALAFLAVGALAAGPVCCNRPECLYYALG